MKNISPDIADETADHSTDHAEYEARLVYSLLRAAVQIAGRARLTSKRLQELISIAYFQSLRAEGATLREIAEIFGQTRRSVANLSQRAKVNFLSPEREYSLPRRIEFHLWKQPLSIEELVAVLPDCGADEIQQALETLIEQERACSDDDGERYQVVSKQANLLSEALKSRVDGLNNLVDAVGDLVESRFLDEDDTGMARTVTFRAPASAVPALKQELFDLVFKYCSLLDDQADPEDDSLYLVYAISPVVNERVR